jgi:outer membrane protein TolC
MKHHKRWTVWLSILVLAAAAGAQENTAAESLSLQDCIAQALKNNLGVAIQVLGPQYAQASESLAKEAFLPTFSLGFSKQGSTSVSYSFLDSSGNITSRTSNYNFSGTQFLPYGGTFTLSATGYETSSNQNYQTINPRFGTTLRFLFSQPLLKNFGYDISRYNILVAKKSLSISVTQLKQSLLDTIYSVESAYWNLVYAIENLKVGQQAVGLAQDLLDINKRMVEVGTLAPTEILSAESALASRQADIIQFETQVQGASDQLRVLLNMPSDDIKTNRMITPKDSPTVEEHKIDLDTALATALEYRPDLASGQLGIDLQQLNQRYVKNQLLPELDLTAYYSGSGISGTEILYDGNPLLGAPVIGTIPGNFSGAIRDTLKFKYPNWSVGLSLTIPVADFVSRAAAAEARVTLQQAVLSLKNQKLQDFLQIRNDIRAVDSNFKRINAYRVARQLAEQTLATEQEKFRVGQSTNYLVLSYQTSLETARISELNAIVAYNISLATLDHDLGISLKDRNVQLTDYFKD